MKIVMIHGAKRSGKDTLANIMKEQLEAIGMKVELVSFAEPMKQIIATMFGISLEDLEHYKNYPESHWLEACSFFSKEPMHTTDFRQVLQRFGTEAMKPIFGDNIWAKLALEKMVELERNGTDVCLITDFRFIEEYVTLSKAGMDVDIVHILRDNRGSTDAHASEKDLSTEVEIDCTIHNDGSLEDLTLKASHVSHVVSLYKEKSALERLDYFRCNEVV